jgi:uncharacterized protein (DUF1501 family)
MPKATADNPSILQSFLIMCNHHKPKDNPRHGSALEHGQAHERDHQLWSRRLFMKNLGIAGSVSMMLGRVPLTAMGGSPLAYALNNGDSDRILILIRLKGGNDALNMIVPVFDYGAYQAMRPGISIPQSELIALSDAFAMPNTMEPLQRLWEDGQMKVINSVGYPEQNLSHFRSSDIWSSASDAGEVIDSGWLGRWLDGEYPNFQENPPVTPPAIQIGGSGNQVFRNEDGIDMGVLVDNPEQLAEIARNGFLYDASDVPECYVGEQISFLRTAANSTFRYADIINEAFMAGANAVEYQGRLGEQFALIARLIKGGLHTRLYMVTLDGFDTHANQKAIHPVLMRQLSGAVRQFYDDLAVGGVDHRVLSMTNSEFGRRPQQNASGGCDHGSAAAHLMFGPGLEGNGFVGQGPDLRNLDLSGNLRFDIDFRRIYATVLEGWLCIDGATVDAVLGQSFQRLPDLGLSCATTATPAVAVSPPLRHWTSYGQGQMTIHYLLQKAATVHIQVFSILGQPIATIENQFRLAGEHRAVFQPPFGFAAGTYVYRIRAGRRIASGKMVMR